MLALGIYTSQYSADIKQMYTELRDSDALRAAFLREYGRVPSKIILIKNGESGSPEMIEEIFPTISETSWKLISTVLALCVVAIILLMVGALGQSIPPMIVAVITMLIAAGLLIYQGRYEKKRLLNTCPDCGRNKDNAAHPELPCPATDKFPCRWK